MRLRAHWIASIALTLSSFSAWAADPLTLHALLVGIDTYENADRAGLPTLRGPSNDIASMRAVLSERFGLADANTTVLRNEQAKRDLLLYALRKVFVDDPKPGEVALFYFSGHGSRVFDSSSDEPSKYDSAILPYDARADASNARDIIDDELGEIVTASIAKGVQPIVILDSCYSGTGIRFMAQARYAPAIKRAFPPSARTVKIGPASMRGVVSGYGMLLAAAQDTEEALEMERDGLVQGEFTRALVSILRSAESDVTYLDVLTRVRVGLAAIGVPQHPQGEGDLQQRFLGSGPLGLPPVLAEPIDERTVRLLAGSASGVTAKSRYDFFSSAAAAVAGTSPLVSGDVADVQSDNARVRVTTPSQTLPTMLFATEKSHAYGNLRLLVAVSGGAQAQRDRINSVLAKLDFVSVVSISAATHWIQINDSCVQLSAANAAAIGPCTPLGSDIGTPLATSLGRLAHVEALLSLSNPQRPKSPIIASIVLASASTQDLKNPPLRDGEAHLPAGQPFKLSLFNSESKAEHVYVLNIAPDLCVRLLSPPPYGSDAPLTGLARTKLLSAGPTQGREYFLVLATDLPVAIEALQQPCLGTRSTRAAVKNYDDPLAQLFRNAGAARRGARPSIPLNGWATGFISMVVE